MEQNEKLPFLIGTLETEEKIAEWKGKYPHGIFAIEADGGKISYFKNPNMTELNCALSEFSLDKPLTAYYELAHILFIGGNEDWKDENNLAHALAVIDAMKECSRACQSRVVKL